MMIKQLKVCFKAAALYCSYDHMTASIFRISLLAIAVSLTACSSPESLPAASPLPVAPSKNLSNTPPSALFSPSCTGLTCSFDAGLSSDTDGSIVSYAWTFGDGAVATGVTANHTFVADGSYTVVLTVTDDNGAASSSSQTIFVSSGNVAPVVSFTSTCPNLSCSFDAGASSDSDGSVVVYNWDFGDGTQGSGATINHVYSADGNYIVMLTVTDDVGASSSASQNLSLSAAGGGNVSPSASFLPNCTNLDCSFDASASTDSDGTIVSYGWDFGDSTTATGKVVNHSYSADGVYNVVLTVSDDFGASSTSNQSVSVSSGNLPPSAAFTFSCTYLDCNFDASSSSDPDGGIASYAWNFGDGSLSGAGVTTSHSYVISTTSSNFPVTLTVTDTNGTASNSSQSVTVTAPPPAIDGQALYTSKCATCHGADGLGGTLSKIDIRGSTAAQISTAIATVNQMSKLSSLTSADIQALADYLATL